MKGDVTILEGGADDSPNLWSVDDDDLVEI
jgi:hypothetical protein